MKRVCLGSPNPGGGRQSLAALDSKVFHSLRNVVAHCAVVLYDDGSPRTPGRLFVQTDGSNWTVVAKDPDAQAQLRASAASLDDALALLDMLLGTVDAPWEQDHWARKQGPKKGK